MGHPSQRAAPCLPPISAANREPLAAPANGKQVKARPPTFAAFLGGRDEVPLHAARFLANAIRESLGFEGVPVRILFRYKTTEDGRRRTPRAAAAGAGRWQHRRAGGASSAPAGGRFGDGPGRAAGEGGFRERVRRAFAAVRGSGPEERGGRPPPSFGARSSTGAGRRADTRRLFESPPSGRGASRERSPPLRGGRGAARRGG